MLLKLTYLFLLICCSISLSATDPPKTSRSAPDPIDDRSIFYSAEASNLIKNPEFEKETKHWFLGKYNGGSATLATDSACDKFKGRFALIKTSGVFDSNYEDIQLFSFLEISRNTNYKISFKASVHEECLISLTLSNGIETYFEEKLLLRPGQTNYGPFIYKGGFDESFAFFSFNLGKTHNSIAFDDISILADNTEKDFNELLAKSGINIEMIANGRELYISLPTSAKSDYPLIVVNDKGQTVKAQKILEGNQEGFINLQNTYDPGDYLLKIISPDKLLTYKFKVD